MTWHHISALWVRGQRWVFVQGQRLWWGGGGVLGSGTRGNQGRSCLCASVEDNLMTVEGGSGCLKELSIPAALLRREVKAICPTSKTKHTHTFMPSVPNPDNRWRRSTVPNLNTRKPTHTASWQSWQCASYTGAETDYRCIHAEK